jgi:ABC-2 type transport system ATP-binding protein
MWKVIENLMRDGATILLTTQYLEEADKLADRIAVIDHGKVIAEGTADELKNRVGKNRLELVISRVENLNQAQSVIGIVGTVINNDEKLLTVPIEGAVKDVKNILDRLEKANIDIESMSLHKPTLDDVFLNVTGHDPVKDVKTK